MRRGNHCYIPCPTLADVVLSSCEGLDAALLVHARLQSSVTSVGSLQLVHYESLLFVRGTVPYTFSWCYKLVYKKDMGAKITDCHEYDDMTFNDINMTFNIFSKKWKNAAIGTLFWLNC